MATTTNNGWATPNDSDAFKQGASAIRTLGSAIDTSVGTGLLAWTAYTPTLSGVTVGNGTSTFKYAKLGKIVHVRGIFVLGSTSAMTGPLDVSLPFNSSGYGTIGQQPDGTASFYNGSSVYNYGFLVSLGSATSFRIQVINVASTYQLGSDLSSTVPFAWSSPSGKFFACQFTYESV